MSATPIENARPTRPTRPTQPDRPFFLAINGSERPAGNIAAALEVAREQLDQRGVGLEVIRLWDLEMTPCGPCGDCNFRTQPCALDDDVAGSRGERRHALDPERRVDRLEHGGAHAVRHQTTSSAAGPPVGV